MSRHIPYASLQKEQIAQIFRRTNGLKTGEYVRIKVGPRHTVLMTAAKAAKQGLTPLTEEEFQELVNPKSPAPTAKSDEPQNETPKNELTNV